MPVDPVTVQAQPTGLAWPDSTLRQTRNPHTKECSWILTFYEGMEVLNVDLLGVCRPSSSDAWVLLRCCAAWAACSLAPRPCILLTLTLAGSSDGSNNWVL